jgi:hypothetical protein
MLTSVQSIYFVDLPLMIVLISLVYSGTRYDAPKAILAESLRWGGRLFGFLLGIAIVLFLVHKI